ncbi:MAG: hypothetical protein H6737_31785 [Alphaproteobacteria bacterium]|nr:hypothetical protein [Alphaproteobacteria bacterium]
MPTWTQADATCEIFTYKAGLLSAVGHDLLLKCTKFTLTLEDGGIHGDFDGSAIEVVGAMKHGHLEPGTLSEKDRRDILDNIRNHVFKRHDQAAIHFECDEVEEHGELLEGEGTLTIPPNQHDITFEVHVEDDRALCKVKLHQPDWGIKPFSALMGTLKIQPDIEIRVTVPWS